MKKYKVILVVPPRGFDNGNSQKNDFEGTGTLPSSLQEIADEDCLLFLGVSPGKLPEGVLAIEEWGFKYLTISCSGEEFLCLIAGNGESHQLPPIAPIKGGGPWKNIARVKEAIDRSLPGVPKIELFTKGASPGWDTLKEGIGLTLGTCRKSGRSTRLLDKYVQAFFKEGEVFIKDHHNTGKASKKLLFRFCNRLVREHPKVEFNINLREYKVSRIIALPEPSITDKPCISSLS